MNILALETSSRFGSIAVYHDDHLLGQAELRSDRQTAQSLAPAIMAILNDVDLRVSEIDLIAVAEGPGSFTGLRVGITTAKTFAYATGCDVIGLNTLEIIASQIPDHSAPIYSIVDAQRRQLYSATFQNEHPGIPKLIQPTSIIDIEPWIHELPAEALVTGPGLKKVADILPEHVEKASENQRNPQAVTVGRLAFLYYQAGRRDDFWKMVPKYYRKSAAEEKLKSPGSLEAN